MSTSGSISTKFLPSKRLPAWPRSSFDLGVEKIRLTGGEPLVRHNLDHLVAKLSVIGGLKDLCLTTNAALLADQIAMR